MQEKKKLVKISEHLLTEHQRLRDRDLKYEESQNELTEMKELAWQSIDRDKKNVEIIDLMWTEIDWLEIELWKKEEEREEHVMSYQTGNGTTKFMFQPADLKSSLLEETPTNINSGFSKWDFNRIFESLHDMKNNLEQISNEKQTSKDQFTYLTRRLDKFEELNDEILSKMNEL